MRSGLFSTLLSQSTHCLLDKNATTGPFETGLKGKVLAFKRKSLHPLIGYVLPSH